MDAQFDYGDEVVLKSKDESGNLVTKQCWIVSITKIEHDEQALHFRHPIGTVLYTVEFSDGSDELVSELDVSPLSSR